MSDPALRVIRADLHSSASQIDMHAAELKAMHAAAHARIDGAMPYIPGLAAAALAAKATEWQRGTAILTGRLNDHATAMHSSAVTYADTDAGNARRIVASGDPAAGSFFT
jgi:uncharacterized protein YukE